MQCAVRSRWWRRPDGLARSAAAGTTAPVTATAPPAAAAPKPAAKAAPAAATQAPKAPVPAQKATPAASKLPRFRQVPYEAKHKLPIYIMDSHRVSAATHAEIKSAHRALKREKHHKLPFHEKVLTDSKRVVHHAHHQHERVHELKERELKHFLPHKLVPAKVLVEHTSHAHRREPEIVQSHARTSFSPEYNGAAAEAFIALHN